MNSQYQGDCNRLFKARKRERLRLVKEHENRPKRPYIYSRKNSSKYMAKVKKQKEEEEKRGCF